MTARVELPHPHLIWLRSAATLVISAVIGQAGFAAAAIGRRDKSYFFFHAIGAGLTLTLAIGCAICFTVLRRTAGRVLLWLAWATAAGQENQQRQPAQRSHRSMYRGLAELGQP